MSAAFSLMCLLYGRPVAIAILVITEPIVWIAWPFVKLYLLFRHLRNG